MTPVNIKWSRIDQIYNFTEGHRRVTKSDKLADEMLPNYLKDESIESQEVFSLSSLEDIMAQEIGTSMSESNEKSIIRNLFFSYHIIFKR